MLFNTKLILRRPLQRRWPRHQRHSSGQALVELALSATFLAFLFAAAVDLGLAYKSYQTLINATAEASSFLTVNKAIPCGSTTCDPFVAADREARIRFRAEQGDQLRGSSSTLDLDGDRKDDLAAGGNNYGENWINQMVQIHVADSTQVTVSNSNFAIGTTFNGTSDPNCLQRMKFDVNGGQCFIVVRSQITYRPFAISPVVGSTMTIRAISVKPIVN